MNIDTGTAIIIIAVLIFYLRLIIIQRERVKRIDNARRSAPGAQNKKKKGDQSQPIDYQARYSIISRKRSDWIIAGIGIALMLVSILFNTNLFPFPQLQAYWWVPMAIGIVCFSFAFRLNT